MFLSCFQSETFMRPPIVVLAPSRHRPCPIKPSVCEGKKKRDNLNDEAENLVSVAAAAEFEHRVQFHRKTGKIVKEKDDDKTEREFADAGFDRRDVFCGPHPGDARGEEVGDGTENGEGEVGADEAAAVDVGVEAEVAGVVADGEGDAEDVEGEEEHGVERRVGDLGDGVDIAHHFIFLVVVVGFLVLVPFEKGNMKEHFVQ